jgi:tetratricopeptide (TPR) repeat protein
MKFSSPSIRNFLCLLTGFCIISAPIMAQELFESTPVNEALREQAVQDRAASYYHYSLGRWHLSNGDSLTAISEMNTALRYNRQSIAIHMELAIIQGRTGNIAEAILHSEEAIRLDPLDPEPHWLLADIYIRARGRRGAPPDSLRKAVQQLEHLKELNPNDERVYFNLGGAYFELDEPEKAIESYETFQQLSKGVDFGYREIAKYYENQGDLEKAIDYLDRGLRVQPNSPESLDMLGVIYSRLNRNEEAAPLFKKLLDVIGNNTTVTRKLAISLFEAGKFEEAAGYLNDLVERRYPDRTSQVYYGRARMELLEYPEAIIVFQNILEYNPDDVEAKFYLGRSLQATGRYSEALEIFTWLVEKSIGISPENRAVFRQNLAAVHLELGDYDKAFSIYEEMARIDPRVNGQLLNAYRIGRQFEKALPFGRHLFEKDPENIPIGISYARVLADAGKTHEGVEILKKLLQSNPEDIDLYIILSQLYVQGGYFTDADNVLRKAESTDINDENSERLKFHRAAFHERNKEYGRAETLFRELLEENPRNAIVLNYLGYMLADLGIRLDEAVHYIRSALDLDPYNGAYLDSLGWAFYQMDELEKAERYLLKASELARNDATIKQHLGDLYFKTGDLEKAQNYWKKAISIGTNQEDIQKVRQKLDDLQDHLGN